MTVRQPRILLEGDIAPAPADRGLAVSKQDKLLRLDFAVDQPHQHRRRRSGDGRGAGRGDDQCPVEPGCGHLGRGRLARRRCAAPDELQLDPYFGPSGEFLGDHLRHLDPVRERRLDVALMLHLLEQRCVAIEVFAFQIGGVQRVANHVDVRLATLE